MHLVMLLLSASLSISPSYALVTPSDTSVYGAFTADDIETIRNVYGPRVFFFRNNGGAYVVFDKKTIESIELLFQRERDLGRRPSGVPSEQSRKVRDELSTLTEQWIKNGVAKSLQR